MKFFSAVIVSSADGSSIEKHDFDDPVKAFIYLFTTLTDAEQKGISKLADDAVRLFRYKPHIDGQKAGPAPR